MNTSTPNPPEVPSVVETTDPAAFVRKVGKGKTLSKSLGRAEAREAFALLLEGGFTDAQAGAFLQALRINELSQDELDGLMDCLLEEQPRALPVLPAGGFTLNLASDTPRKGGYVSLLAAALLAGEGVSVGVVRSEPLLSGNRESWDATWALAGSACGLHDAGCCDSPHAPALLFPVEAHDLAPRLRNLRKIRRELGFRSCLHTAEKLLNPWTDKPVVLGISHKNYAARMADHFARRGMAAKIVLGNHGTPDLVLHKETEVCEVLSGGEIRTVFFHPEALGLKPEATAYSQAFFPRWAEELAKPGFGILGPVLEYQIAFFRYVLGTTTGTQAGMTAEVGVA
jgi:anthranilate phosphoribosyltransferase